MEKLLLYLLLFAVFAVIAVVVGYYTRKAEAKRSAALAEVAAGLTFDFSPGKDDDLTTALAAFWLFGHGHTKEVWNRFRGTATDRDVEIFDYQYVTGSGKSRQVFGQTVVRVRRPGAWVPSFTLRPESFWHKVGALFGTTDINFDSHPAFSKQYLLKGRDEAAVRAAFTEPVLDYFEDRPGLCVEAAGEEVLFYRQQSRVEPTAEAVRQLLTDAFDVLSLFPGTEPPEEPDEGEDDQAGVNR
jgi:hypothetical protein